MAPTRDDASGTPDPNVSAVATPTTTASDGENIDDSEPDEGSPGPLTTLLYALGLGAVQVAKTGPSFTDLLGKAYNELVAQTITERESAREAAGMHSAALSVAPLPEAPTSELQQLRAMVAGLQEVQRAQSEAAAQQARSAEQLAMLASVGQKTHQQLVALEQTIQRGDESSDRMSRRAVWIAIGLGLVGAVGVFAEVSSAGRSLGWW